MILASQSPRRQEILAALGIELIACPQDIDETALPQERPLELVSRLASEKAHACVRELKAKGQIISEPEYVVGADTIVWLKDEILGKPCDACDAARMLAELSGKVHHVSTAVCVIRISESCESVNERSFVETTSVEFFELSKDEIDSYVATKESLDKAGAYGYQGLGRTLVKRIDGDYYNVVGLPVARLMRTLAEMEELEV